MNQGLEKFPSRLPEESQDAVDAVIPKSNHKIFTSVKNKRDFSGFKI